MASKMLRSFLPISPDSHFSLQNLPYGVFRPDETQEPRPGVAIGDYVLDLRVLAETGLFSGTLLSESTCFEQTSLNSFMALGRSAWKEARRIIQNLLSENEPTLRDNLKLRQKALVHMTDVTMELPAVIGDYSDFFSSKDHVVTCGTIYRGKDYRLPPNWLYMPLAYHGRSSSIVVSGTDIIRPWGQIGPTNGTSPPQFRPSARIDFELEMATFVGPGNDLGVPVGVQDSIDHVFGLVLMNDWSARDIQKWESTPLGPFLGKSFGTTISPWVVTLEALEPFLCEAPIQDPAPLCYLEEQDRRTYDIPLQVSIRPDGSKRASVVCQSNFKYLYWTLSQQLTHHTISGCNLKPGDLLASGTISGPIVKSNGSMLELSWNGQKDIELEDGGNRRFLEDGDEVTITACCQGDGFVVGFGTCSGKVVPAINGKAFWRNSDPHHPKGFTES